MGVYCVQTRAAPACDDQAEDQLRVPCRSQQVATTNWPDDGARSDDSFPRILGEIIAMRLTVFDSSALPLEFIDCSVLRNGMGKILGIGGVFLKVRDSAALGAWYRDALGLDLQSWGGAVFEPAPMAAQAGAATVFSLFAADTDYFAPSAKELMINFAVDDLDAVLARLAQHGVTPIKRLDESHGRFAHILDPEGTKIELWEPKAE